MKGFKTYTGEQIVAFTVAHERHKRKGAAGPTKSDRRYAIAFAMAEDLKDDPVWRGRPFSPMSIYHRLCKLPQVHAKQKVERADRGELFFSLSKKMAEYLCEISSTRDLVPWPERVNGGFVLPKPTRIQRLHIARNSTNNGAQQVLGYHADPPAEQAGRPEKIKTLANLLRHPEIQMAMLTELLENPAIEALLLNSMSAQQFSVQEVAALVGMPAWKIYKLASDGVGNGKKIAQGARKAVWRFDKAEIEAFRAHK